jgi:hypothetical protein
VLNTPLAVPLTTPRKVEPGDLSLVVVQSDVRDFRTDINSGHLAKIRAAPSRRD